MTDPQHTKQAKQKMFRALHEYHEAKDHTKTLDQHNGSLRNNGLAIIGVTINRAVELILSARELDAFATITDQNHEITIDDIIERLLLPEAIAYSRTTPTTWTLGEKWEIIHAADVLKKYLTYRPDNLSAVVFYVRTLVRLKQITLARTTLDNLLEHNPDNHEAWAVLSDLEKVEKSYLNHPDSNDPFEYSDREWLQIYPIGKLP